ncbi:rab-GTPase-TBC domain-containing protein [Mariannaea sp. PMI_226]|nr:rab-GTPase-TBC domain-containing protein [Mariannaea sp. PMI_226]
MDPEPHSSFQGATAVPSVSRSDLINIVPTSDSTTQACSSSSPTSSLSGADATGDDRVPFVSQKREEILDACNWRDIGRLRSLAEGRGGLLSDALRRLAYQTHADKLRDASKGPSYLDSSFHPSDDVPVPGDPPVDTVNWRNLPHHRDEDQVQLDVHRSFVHYPKNLTASEMDFYKSELSALINEVLRRYPFLCYFQGYHDICQVLLLVLGPAWRARALARLSILRIRDFMLPTMTPTIAQLHLILDIISNADPNLRRHLADIEPFFALSDTLTMYAHNIEEYQGIARLFDVLLAREPVFIIYMFAQIIICRRDDIFDIDEPDMLHVFLSRVPTKMDLDQLIAASCRLFELHPPETLRSWRRISSTSALKTARNVDDCARQSLDEGKEMFQKQVKDIQRAEFYQRVKKTLWAYRPSAKAIGLAIGVGALAIYLRHNPTIINRIFTVFSR